MFRVALITTANKEEAEKIADALLEEKVIACANVLDSVSSRFWWEEKIDSSDEALIIAKTTAAKMPDVIRIVKDNHSYDCPEVIALPVEEGNPEYLKWIEESVRK